MRESLKNYILGIITLILLLCPVVGAEAGNDLSHLSYDDKSNIELACVLERSNGPVAYNVCVASQLQMLGNERAADLSGLSYDDKSNIKLACVLERSNGPTAYNKCVKAQLHSLGKSSSADLSKLTYDDKSNIELACVLERSNGPVAYNKCVGEQLSSLETNVPLTKKVESSSVANPTQGKANSTYPYPTYSGSGGCAENGSCYGDRSSITGRPKTTHVKGYYRKDGTYVRGHYRSKK